MTRNLPESTTYCKIYWLQLELLCRDRSYVHCTGRQNLIFPSINKIIFLKIWTASLPAPTLYQINCLVFEDHHANLAWNWPVQTASRALSSAASLKSRTRIVITNCNIEANLRPILASKFLKLLVYSQKLLTTSEIIWRLLWGHTLFT